MFRKCGINEATVRFVKIENNNQTELHLCQSCAGLYRLQRRFDLRIFFQPVSRRPLRSKIRQKEKTCELCGELPTSKSRAASCSQ